MAQPTAAHSTRSTPSRAFHPTDYLRTFYKRRWVAVPGFLLVFLSGAIGSLRTVPIYEATTPVLVEPEARRNTTLDSVVNERDGWTSDDFYPTQIRLLKSRALALKVAKSLKAQNEIEHVPQASGMSFSVSGAVSTAMSSVSSMVAPAKTERVVAVAEPTAGEVADAEVAAMAASLAGRLTPTLARQSRIVELRFRSADPHFAQRAANEFAKQYVNYNIEMRSAASAQTNEFLIEQVKAQKLLVDQSEQQLLDYKVNHNAAAVDDKQNIVIQKLNALNSQVVNARLERITAEANVKALEQMERNNEPLDGFPAVLGSEAVQKIKSLLQGKEQEKARLAAQGIGERMQSMVEVNNAVSSLKADLASEIGKVVSSMRSNYLTAKSREDGLVASLNAQQGEVSSLDRKSLEYNKLERDAKSNRELYETLLLKTKEANVSRDYRGTNITPIDWAEEPTWPVLPQTQRDLVTSALGGLVLALGLAFGFEYFDSRIKAPEEIKQHLDVPFLGMIPAVKASTDHGGESLMLHADVPPSFGEAIRGVRTAVLFSSAEEGARSLVITSTGPHEGKTLVSSSLAIAIAQAGQRTVVVDADMRRPRLHEALGRSQEPGLSNVLVGEATLSDATRATSVENLWVLSAGHIPPNPAELLGSKKYADLFDELKRRFDWVIIDAPPVMPVTDAALIANTAGGVLFVIGSEMTPRQNAMVAIDQLRGANAKFVGAVLNRVNLTKHSYYYAPYYRKEYAKYYQRSNSRA
jgi:succinoglycan biosynthesis transport protein ExoP